VPLARNKKNGTLIINKREFRSRLRKILGTRPGKLNLYEIAFIHRSASFKLPDGKKINNERLEYLGDSILDAILSDYLFEIFPEGSEGFMTKIRSRIVNREILNHLALSMGLDDLLVTRVKQENSSDNLYGNALEALIGALFIDKGFRKTRKIFIKKVLNRYLNLDQIIKTDTDHKSLIFEWVQKNKSNLLFTCNEEYDFSKKQQIFSSTLIIDGVEYGTGTGSSKKEAEQRAAGTAWTKLRDFSPDI